MRKEPKRKHSTEKQIAINMFFSIVSFVVSLGISFFVTPYITSQFGSEAYGFVRLADDFTRYATLFSVALNSMASRFLILRREQGDIEGAQKYFSSITLANIVVSLVMAIPSLICVIYLDDFLNVPPALVSEVKLTFAITFAYFLLNFLFMTYGNCYYLTNKLDLSAIRESIATILRAAIILILFEIATPRISYLAMAGLAAATFTVIFNFYHTRKLTSEFRFRFADFEWKRLVEVLSAGIWNSITRLSNILASGLDLLLTNMMIGSQMMGYLSLAKTIPMLVANFSETIAQVFVPNLMTLYARNDMAEMKKATKMAVKVMCLFVSIPNAILITMGTAFFGLWVPGEPAEMINLLAVLTIITTCVTGPAQPLYTIFVITNKVRQDTIVSSIRGFASVLITYICLRTTGWGVYAVVGVSLVSTLIITLGYHIPYAAHHMGLPKYTFFPEVGICIVSNLVLCGVGYLVSCAVNTGASWVMWFAAAGLTGILGLLINVMLFFNKEERAALLQTVVARIKK